MVTHLRGMNKTIEAETAEERLQTRQMLPTKNGNHENTSDGDQESEHKESV